MSRKRKTYHRPILLRHPPEHLHARSKKQTYIYFPLLNHCWYMCCCKCDVWQTQSFLSCELLLSAYRRRFVVWKNSSLWKVCLPHRVGIDQVPSSLVLIPFFVVEASNQEVTCCHVAACQMRNLT